MARSDDDVFDEMTSRIIDGIAQLAPMERQRLYAIIESRASQEERRDG